MQRLVLPDFEICETEEPCVWEAICGEWLGENYFELEEILEEYYELIRQK